MAVRAIIFDLFGTLIEPTSPERQIIRAFKLKESDFQILNRWVVGKGIKESKGWQGYLSNILKAVNIPKNPENISRLQGVFDSCFKKAVNGVKPWARRNLQNLRGKNFLLCLASEVNPLGRKILETTGFIPLFDFVVLSNEIEKTKRDKEFYQHCVRRIGLPPEQIVMVGDSLKYDVLAAREATSGKIRVILIDPKPSAEARKAGCMIIGSIKQVPRAISLIERPKRKIRRDCAGLKRPLVALARRK